ncbi:MAG: DMT family transporter, partial [Chloroflexi bacterium]|nr:DMT family transporter [Chloroflexota bacterium]
MSSATSDQHEGSSDSDEADSSSPVVRRPLDLKAGLFVFFVSTLWSGNWIAIKAGLDYAPALRLGWMRFTVGGIFVLCWAIYTRADLRIHRGEWRPLIWLAVLLVGQIILLNVGITHTTAGHASVLIVTSAIWVTVLSQFFIPGDRLAPIRFVGVLIAYLGIVVISADSLTETDSNNLILGDILVAISGFLLGLRIVYNARVVAQIDVAKTLLFQAAAGTAALIVLSTIFESEPWL